MRKIILLSALLITCGCQQVVKVPSTKELIASQKLLTEWRLKCETGEYSHLPANQKAGMCTTTNEAMISIAQIKAGNEEADFFKNNTIRKK